MNKLTLAILGALPELKKTLGIVNDVSIKRIEDTLLDMQGQEDKCAYLLLDEQGRQIAEVGWVRSPQSYLLGLSDDKNRQIKGENVGNAIMRLSPEMRKEVRYVAEVGHAGAVVLHRTPDHSGVFEYLTKDVRASVQEDLGIQK